MRNKLLMNEATMIQHNIQTWRIYSTIFFGVFFSPIIQFWLLFSLYGIHPNSFHYLLLVNMYTHIYCVAEQDRLPIALLALHAERWGWIGKWFAAVAATQHTIYSTCGGDGVEREQTIAENWKHKRNGATQWNKISKSKQESNRLPILNQFKLKHCS